MRKFLSFSLFALLPLLGGQATGSQEAYTFGKDPSSSFVGVRDENLYTFTIPYTYLRSHNKLWEYFTSANPTPLDCTFPSSASFSLTKGNQEISKINGGWEFNETKGAKAGTLTLSFIEAGDDYALGHFFEGGATLECIVPHLESNHHDYGIQLSYNSSTAQSHINWVWAN